MAIDLFCYVSNVATEVKKALDLMADTHKELFTRKFLISPIRDVEQFHKETALEYGLNANCIFLVRINDKSAVNLLSTVESVIKSTLGVDNVIILFENETLR